MQAVQFFHGVQIECGQVGFGFRSYGNFHRLYQKDGILFPKSVLYLILTGVFVRPCFPNEEQGVGELLLCVFDSEAGASDLNTG